MKSHSIPSLLGIAAVLVAALVVAIAFGVATDSPAAQAQTPMVDYDTDGDGLIEIKTPAQLAAVALDPGGDGIVQGGDDQTAYDAAFPNAAQNMGCVNDADDPANCTGYELMADIDLAGDDWTPIATYNATFEGNGNTISGLTIDASADLTTAFGLFAVISGTVRNVGLVGVDITVTATSTNNMIDVGGLAGMNSGTVSNSSVTGSITVTRGDGGGTSNAGGLVGENSGGNSITASYAAVAVTVSLGTPNAGGLVGNNAGDIAASYATGDVSATASQNQLATAGGLAGTSGGTIMASYATGDASATAPAPSSGNATAGGLVGEGGGVITASYSTGAPTATVDTGTASEGGLKGSGSPNAVDSYWDADASGIATTTATGVPTSTVALQAPTGYGTSTNPADIFVTWNLAIGTTTPSDPWDFGGNWQYPVLKYLSPRSRSKQRSQVTLVLSEGTVSEKLEDDHGYRHPGGDARTRPTTITATEVEITVSDGATADSKTRR